MARIFRAVTWLVVYGCVGTVLTGILLLGYVAHAWQVDRERLAQTLAVAQGGVAALPREKAAGAGESPAEQASYEQVIERRALASRNLELREQSLKSAIERLRSGQKDLVAEENRYQQVKESFEKEVKAVRDGAQTAGREEVRLTLESIKPKQAKEQLLQMLEKHELDEVVTLLSAMPDAKRARIIGEFKAPAEAEKLAEILRRIREAAPVTSPAENVEKQLKEGK